MADGNEQLVRAAYDALRRDDFDAFLEFIDPEVEWHSLVLEMEGTFRGHEGVREWWRSLRQAFPDWSPDLGEIHDRGDTIVVHAVATASGAISGVGIAGDFWQVAKVRDGLIVEYHAVRTKDEALRLAD
jgi:ketosteroid isomerase-like protein